METDSIQTKGFEEMTREELVAKVSELENDLKGEKALSEYRRGRIYRLEEILNSIGIVYEVYQSDKTR